MREATSIPCYHNRIELRHLIAIMVVFDFLPSFFWQFKKNKCMESCLPWLCLRTKYLTSQIPALRKKKKQTMLFYLWLDLCFFSDGVGGIALLGFCRLILSQKKKKKAKGSLMATAINGFFFFFKALIFFIFSSNFRKSLTMQNMQFQWPGKLVLVSMHCLKILLKSNPKWLWPSLLAWWLLMLSTTKFRLQKIQNKPLFLLTVFFPTPPSHVNLIQYALACALAQFFFCWGWCLAQLKLSASFSMGWGSNTLVPMGFYFSFQNLKFLSFWHLRFYFEVKVPPAPPSWYFFSWGLNLWRDLLLKYFLPLPRKKKKKKNPD